MSKAHFVLWMTAVLAGCATTTSDVGQVQEVEPGTYKIGVGRVGNSVLIGGDETTTAAVEQAGQYCRAKGQKLVIVPTQGKDLTFRCGENIKPDE